MLTERALRVDLGFPRALRAIALIHFKLGFALSNLDPEGDIREQRLSLAVSEGLPETF